MTDSTDATRPAGVPAPSGRPLDADDLVALHRSLADLVAARVPLPEGLATFAAELESGRLRDVVDALRGDLAQGTRLTDALTRRGDALPLAYRELLAAGEAAGDLAPTLRTLAERAQGDADVARHMREALAYPAVVLVATVVGLGTIAAQVSPRYAAIYSMMGVEGRFTGPELVATLVVVGVAALVGIPLLLRRAASSSDDRALSAFAGGLAVAIGRGLAAPRAVRAHGPALDGVLPAAGLEALVGRLEAGQALSLALAAEATFPRAFVEAVRVGESRRDLAGALRGLARRHERRFQDRVLVVSALAAPLTLAAIGVVLGAGLVATIQPVFVLPRVLGQ